MNFSRTFRFFMIFLVFLINSLFAQITTTEHWVNGFAKYIAGENLDYHSCHPDANLSILIRSLNDKDYIEWETDTVSQNYAGDKVTFAWIGGYSVGSTKAPQTFTLFVNDKPSFTFHTSPQDKKEDWNIKGKDAQLGFKFDKIDQAGDFFGYFTLTIPTKELSDSRTLKIKVKGDASGSRDWYMTMQYPLVPKIKITTEKIVTKDVNGNFFHQVKVSIDHFDINQPVKIVSDGHEMVASDLTVGANEFFLKYEEPKVQVQKIIKINMNGLQTEHEVTFSPAKKITFYVIPEAHVDIGYTVIQHEVEKHHWMNYDKAIQYSKRSASYPEESVFKWNTESLWAVKSYLKEFPEKRAQFIDAVKKGWMNLDANYANILTGLCRPEELYQMVDYSNILEKETGVKIESAIISDIPGYTWGIVQAYADNGIKYFSLGPNSSDRIGYILKDYGDKPFYWKSPSGEKKVLVWVAGKGYSWFHHWKLSDGDLSPLVSYLDELDAENYPYDMVHLRYNIGGDNGFPDSALSDFVKNWNETHETPKFVLSSTMKMFKDFEAKYGSQIPTYSGDFTPYWEDGAGSTAKETAINRNAAEQLTQLENLFTLTNKKNIPQDRFEEAWRYVLLFSEHTWGAWNSISDPDDKLVKDQWEVKKSYGFTADSLTQKLYTDFAFDKSPGKNVVKNVRIYNTLSWKRSNIVYIPADIKTAGDYVTDETGKQIKSQRLSTGELAFAAKDVPALDSKLFSFLKKTMANKDESISKNDAGGNSLSNKLYHISIDEKTGSLKINLLKENNYSLSDSSNIYGLNGFVYTGSNAENPVSNGAVTIKQKENGPVVNSFIVESNAPGCNKLTREVKLFPDLEGIEIVNTIDKKMIYEKENVRFVFPFNIPNPETKIDIAWGVIRPEKDQLAGANKNYFTAQRWVDVSNDHIGATLATIDAPLVEIGGMNAESWMNPAGEKWSEKASSSSLIYSWVMNNSWHTNFKAAQDGISSYRYVLLPHAKFDYLQAYRFGVEQSQPLIAVYSEAKKINSSSILKLEENSKVVLSSFKPTRTGKSFMLRLYNPTNEASSTVVKLNGKLKYKLYLSNGDEDRLSEITNKVELKSFEVKTIMIDCENIL
jgi:alpha-mannosidase